MCYNGSTMKRVFEVVVSDRQVMATIVLNTVELEQKVDELTREVRALRNELGRGPPGAA